MDSANVEVYKTDVEIYKTDIESFEQASHVVSKLSEQFPTYKFNVDLHDTDKILRVEGKSLQVSDVQDATRILGFACQRID